MYALCRYMKTVKTGQDDEEEAMEAVMLSVTLL
jgi:hypothetical protein